MGPGQHCREWQPCKVHPPGWEGHNSRPLPPNWERLKKKARERHIALYGHLDCRLCGSILYLEVDHIVPRSEDGPDELWNLQILCKECHGKKTHDDQKKYGSHKKKN